LREFAALYGALDATTRTNEKIAAMVRYFAEAPPADAAWAVYFLSGRRPKRLVQAQLLRLWAGEATGIPLWLVEESYGAVGDAAETAVLLLPPATRSSERSLRYWVEERILPLRELDDAGQRAAILAAWDELDDAQRFVFSKLITGAFRVGVSQRLLTRALSSFSGVDAAVIAHRLMGHWQPKPGFFEAAGRSGGRGGGYQPAVPVLPGLSAGGAAGRPGGDRRVAGRVEVGWDSRPADPAWGREFSLVARRRAGDPSLPGESPRRRRSSRMER
jgi:hypothetical protein